MSEKKVFEKEELYKGNVMTKFYEDKVYIRQCEKAVDLQQTRIDDKGGFIRIHYGDYVCYPDDDDKKHITIINSYSVCYFGEQSGFIIFRQDQLQEMIPEDSIYALYFTKGDWMLKVGVGDLLINDDNSAERLLLQAVMFILFNKTWDGEEWI